MHSVLLKSLLILAAVIFVMSSCSRKVSFLSSSMVPAAEGEVVVKKDNNKNYSIEVNVTNLAPPSKLTPARNAYVVWLQTQANETRNMGQMVSSSGLFSSTLKGTLKSVSAAKPTRVFITAEDSPNVSLPGPQMVLTTKEF